MSLLTFADSSKRLSEYLACIGSWPRLPPCVWVSLSTQFPRELRSVSVSCRLSLTVGKKRLKA